MEDRQTAGGTLDTAYNKLISQDDFSADDHPLDSNRGKQQVSLSMARPESILNRYKLLTLGLAGLAVIQLAVDIGLGVYYNKLTDGHRIIMDINSEVANLQDTYNIAVQRRDEAKKQLASEISQQQLTKWELEHQKKRSKDYEKRIEKIQTEIAVLKSHMPMIEEGCRHCLPGWTYLGSMCYFFAFSESISRRSWLEAREFCTKYGADLAVIDSRETHLAISRLVINYQDTSRPIAHTGFWIGLRDVEEEGIWKWLNGRRLAEGYWNDGEPNNSGNEDCAATYPRSNPFKAWNDAPCNYELKWICEMAPSSVG